MADLLVDFLRHEVAHGRMPPELLPLQSGVGNVANAVMAGLVDSEFEHLTAFTEVIQDGMLDLLDSGKLTLGLGHVVRALPGGVQRFLADVGSYKGRILLRSEEISNHPELVRRLGVIAINGMLEADLYGNVNSTHVMGSSIMNGIGGSGDFARNAFLNFFVSPVDRQGRPDLLDRADGQPRRPHRARRAGPDHRAGDRGPARALAQRPRGPGDRPLRPPATTATGSPTTWPGPRPPGRTPGTRPHLLDEALSWHTGFLETGTM